MTLSVFPDISLPRLSFFVLIFLLSFGRLSIPLFLLSLPLSLSLSSTSPTPCTTLLCPAPCVMSLIHQADSINRIPIAVCSLAAHCCLCLYESITPTLTPTHCLWQIGRVCVCVFACTRTHECVCFCMCLNFKTSSALWPNLLQSLPGRASKTHMRCRHKHTHHS